VSTQENTTQFDKIRLRLFFKLQASVAKKQKVAFITPCCGLTTVWRKWGGRKNNEH
jgi:hypothetical protein